MKSLIFLFALLGSTAQAMNLDWSGVYRFEWMQVDRPSLGTPTERKAYGLQSLTLRPTLIASDGLNIVSQFDVLPSQDPAYANSQAGQLWGQSLPASPNPADATDVDSSRSNVTGRTKPATNLTVRELYLHLSQEYGSLIVGRAPTNFGLGLVYSDGRGAFDHWSTTSDLVSYKFVVGNLWFQPTIARVAAESTAAANVIQDERFQLQYENEDGGSLLGLSFNRRRSSLPMNDINVAVLGGAVVDPYSMQTTGFLLGRSWDPFRFKLEAAFVTGDFGVKKAGEFVKQNGYGVALEMEFPRPESKWEWSVKMGAASGDDPTTNDVESFQFDRNYDVAMLLFNHRLGQRDFLQTNLIKDTGHGLSTSIDDEAISNAAYFSPKLLYRWNERWDVVNTVTYAQLMTNPTNSLDFKKDLGLEWDIEAVYKPRSNVRWVNQLGLLLPGAAFKDGASDLDNGFNFGFATKAAITF